MTDGSGNVQNYIVTVTSWSYVTDDEAEMSDLYPSGVQVLQSIRDYASFEVSGADPTGDRYSRMPEANSWKQQAIFDTSIDSDDAASGKVISSSQRLTSNGELQTTLADNYAIVNQQLQIAKPQLVTVEIQTPDTSSPTGYDNQVQSTSYSQYDDQDNLLYSFVAAARDFGPANAPESDLSPIPSQYPGALAIAFSGLSIRADNTDQILVWNASVSAYQWSDDSVAGDPISIQLTDTSLATRGSGAPQADDAWSLSFSDAGAWAATGSPVN